MKIFITIPAYNEEYILKKNILKLREFCLNILGKNFLICIADNDSSDTTPQIGKNLSKFGNIIYKRVEKRGKGNAIKSAWITNPDFDIYIFMDADLSTDIKAIPDLIKAIKNNYDIAIGSRYHKDSKTKRSPLRKLISFSYRLLAKIILKTKIKDLPCGFKAINRKTLFEIIPLIKNDEWFFDSELVLIAEKNNFKIKEIPIFWEEKNRRKTKIKLRKVIINYLKEMIRIRKTCRK